jgi:predicted GNAT family N-acyltransferase
MLKTPTDRLKSIEYGSEAYNQAAQLRCELFYQEHNIPFESIFDPQEAEDRHFAIINNSDNRVLAYGRLSQHQPNAFQIYQMVVLPAYQGRITQSHALEKHVCLLRFMPNYSSYQPSMIH